MKSLNRAKFHKKGGKKKEAKIQKTRKQLRKEQRQLKKVRRNEFYQRKKNLSKDLLISRDDKNGRAVHKNLHSQEGNFMKSPKQVPDKEKVDQRVVHNNIQSKHENFKKIPKHVTDKEKVAKLQKEMKKQRVKQLKRANEDEEKEIKKLEKQLKLNKHKRKSIPKSFASDGLDYLLEVCEKDNLQQAMAIDRNMQDSGSEFEEDFALVTGTQKRTKLKDSTMKKRTGKSSKSDSASEESEDNEFAGLRSGNMSGDESSDKNYTVSGDQNTDITDESICEDGNISSSEDDNEFSDILELHGNESDALQSDIEDVKAKGVKRKNNIDDANDCNSKSVNKKNKKNSMNQKLHMNFVDEDVGKEVSRFTGPSKMGEKSRKTNKSLLQNFMEEDCYESDSVNIEQLVTTKSNKSTTKHQHDTEQIQGTKKKRKKRKKKKKDTSTANKADDNENFTSDEDIRSINDDSEEVEGSAEKKEPTEQFWEDIYGRTRDKKGNIVQVPVTKYVPPHLRAMEGSKNQEQLSRLRKQMKGLLNRLAESNMSSISSQIEELYMSNSRNDMNKTLTSLLFESLVAPVITPERLIMEHTMLVAILHTNVGTEVGAHILQTVVKQFDEQYKLEQEIENKTLDNIVLVLSHLYNFKVFNSVLMYNILDKLSEKFAEKEVELILLILKNVGFSLRKDDPLALKDLILRLQQKAGEAAQIKNNTRVKFMLDILLAIKNNNMAKIPNYDPNHIEHLKKLMKGFLRKGSYVTELKISLEDLLKADERGRWWVVGSAWTGMLPGETGRSGEDTNSENQQYKTSSQYSEQLLDLARKQRMNTDVRRNIFCILMTAEDFVDAFEKLLHLGLKNQQEREIIYVIMHCCLQEKHFNLYYCHLAQKFCDLDRKYQMMIQCALWDKFKELQNISGFQHTNLAKFLVHLLIEKGLPLSVLKVIHFAEVDKVTVRFLRQVLLGLLLHKSEETIREVFQRVAFSQKLHVFREGIRLFIHHFLLRNLSSHSLENEALLEQRAKMADKILGAADSRLKF